MAEKKEEAVQAEYKASLERRLNMAIAAVRDAEIALRKARTLEKSVRAEMGAHDQRSLI